MKACTQRERPAAWMGVLAMALLLPLAPRLAPADEEPQRQPAPAADKDRPREEDRDAARRDGAPRAEQRDGERREGDREARRDGDRRPKPVKGTVLRFEGETLVIGVGDQQRELVVPLQDKTEFYFREQKIARADLQPGTIVDVHQAEGLTAKVVGINLPRRPDARRDGDQRRDGEDRPVRRDGEGGKAELRRDGDKPREGDREGERPVRRDPAGPRPINGEVIRAEGGNLLIAYGESRREVIVPIDAETRILVNGQEGKLADIQPGDQVAIQQVDGLTRVITVKPRRRPVPAREGRE